MGTILLSRSGLPKSICLHLQDQGLQFSRAVWTAKQSRSVSFFWKTASPEEVKAKAKPEAKKKEKEKEEVVWEVKVRSVD